MLKGTLNRVIESFKIKGYNLIINETFKNVVANKNNPDDIIILWNEPIRYLNGKRIQYNSINKCLAKI